MMHAALTYARRNLAAFPCHDAVAICSCGASDCGSPGKHPRTRNGYRDASTDRDRLISWWQRWPTANVGIATGARSGLVVIDVDVKHEVNGFAALADLERDLGPLPRTRVARTPSGGEHRYFRTGACATLRNRSSRVAGEVVPGVDVRAEGGYVIAPPSHIFGAAYAWTHDIPAAELPERWVAALSPPERAPASVEPWSPRDDGDRSRVHRYCRAALEREARDLASTPAGRRNDELWRSAAALAGLVHFGAITTSDIRMSLLWACSTWERRTPSKDEDTLERAIAFGLAHPRTDDLGGDRAR